MARAIRDDQVDTHAQEPVLDWRKKMSDNIAYALLVYTGLQIFVTVEAMRDPSASVYPYVALAILVAIVIPACKTYESCWMAMTDEQAADESHAPRYRKSVTILWALAIGLPLLLAAFFQLLDTLL